MLYYKSDHCWDIIQNIGKTQYLTWQLWLMFTLNNQKFRKYIIVICMCHRVYEFCKLKGPKLQCISTIRVLLRLLNLWTPLWMLFQTQFAVLDSLLDCNCFKLYLQFNITQPYYVLAICKSLYQSLYKNFFKVKDMIKASWQ